VTVPGPIARDDFFAAQRRHRRAAHALSALAAIAVVLVSVPLAAIVFPLLFGIAALVSMVASAVTGGASLVDRLLATGVAFRRRSCVSWTAKRSTPPRWRPMRAAR
jgi:hypothetical protein